MTDRSELHAFRCNVCGKRNRAPIDGFGREKSSCRKCGSTVRTRSIVHALSTELFGESLTLKEFPKRRDLRGIGLSDNHTVAARLRRRLNYQNTFFHTEPRVDICAPDPAMHGALDFLIASDVFEHVAPPVSLAFENARKLLKPGGVFVFTVPYQNAGSTIEHFPDLFDYRLELVDERHVLINTTRDGREQRFDDLVFHGGPGSTLELRVFTRDDILAHFAHAGFEPPKIFDEDYPPCGMILDCDWSLTMAARAPRLAP